MSIELTPESVVRDPWLFGPYFRDLIELSLDEPVDAGAWGDPLPAYRAGYAFGAAMTFALFLHEDEDARQEVAEQLRQLFPDEIALRAEGHLPA